MQNIFCQPLYTFSFLDLGNMISDVYPGSGSIPDPGIKKAPDPGCRSVTLVSRKPTRINHSYTKDELSCTPLQFSLLS